MVHRSRIWIVTVGLFFTYACHGFGEKTFLAARSLSCQASLDLVGWQPFIYKCTDHNYHVLSIMPTYMHSFEGDKITHYLFGAKQLSFTGSLVPNRGANDILADYFGLPSDYSSIVVFDPQIINFMLRFDWYYGLDSLLPGLFVRFILPIVNTKWDLFLHECILNPGSSTVFYPAGYLGPDRLTRSQLAPNVETAFQGKTTFGDMKEPLAFGKIFGRETMTRASDLIFDCGYVFAGGDWYHAGAMLRVAAPVGNRATPEFLFQPTVGNGHHWEVGAGFTAHVDMQLTECSSASLWSELYVTHLFSANLVRSFDFIKGTGSRYMLIEELAGPAVDLNSAVNTQAAEQYVGRLLPAINKSTLDAKISVPLQIDLVVKGSFTYKQFEFDVGYELWHRSKEHLHKRACLKEGFFAFKGDSQVYGFDVNNLPVALSATQHNATLHAGQGATNFSTNPYQNTNIDNPTPALDSTNFLLNQLNLVDSTALGIPQASVATSNPAIFIPANSLVDESALMPQALSHKVFIHGSYRWADEQDCLQPYLGIGSSVEFAGLKSCKNSAIPQWSVWAKGGLLFD